MEEDQRAKGANVVEGGLRSHEEKWKQVLLTQMRPVLLEEPSSTDMHCLAFALLV